ncbi:hypothetical protein CIB95_08495 [Lottiidibacillus patelloidae]|uniref:Polysaccharide biosynthesis protein n=1 Tax=Lottiidibacillus patelloidae TaxID=2670334 RepID=A0A263BUR2_9BACI|nr:oligosaccharide flippase family protein [Lottiidibacillus patelloidae]OZM57483.1 hypothetical protein CIB95_08495 [Lottiidibacillus patelloidae]
MKWKNLIPKGKFAKNVGVLAGGTAFSQLIIILSTPILTRIYSPEEFGVYSVYLSILSILVVIGSLLYEMAIPLPLPNNNKEAINVLALCFILILLFSILHFSIFTLFAENIAYFLNTPTLAGALWLIPIAFIGGSTFQAVHYWSIRTETFKNISITKLNQSTIQVLSQIILGFNKLGKTGLLIGDVIGRLVAGITITILSFRHEKALLKEVSWHQIRKTASRYRRFPMLSSGSALLNSVSLQLPALLLTAFYGPIVVGLYILAQRILGLPIAIIGGAVSEVYLAEASKINKSDERAIRHLFWKTFKSIALISVVFITTLAVFAPPLFAFVFGDEWKQAGVYLQLLAIMYFFQFVSAPVGSNIPVFERQDFHLYREVIRILLLLITLVFANWLNVTATTAILMLSIAGTFGYIIHTFFSWYAMERHFSLKNKEQNNEY